MVNIRLAIKEDLIGLSEVYVKAYVSADIDEHWNKEKAHELLLSLYNIQPDLFFIAEEDNKPLGAIVGLVRPWWDGYHLADGELFVDPNHQGKEIGKKLVYKLFKTAKQKHKATSWDTFTHVVHEHPLSWYKSMGFEVIKEWTMITGDIDKVLRKLNNLNVE